MRGLTADEYRVLHWTKTKPSEWFFDDSDHDVVDRLWERGLLVVTAVHHDDPDYELIQEFDVTNLGMLMLGIGAPAISNPT